MRGKQIQLLALKILEYEMYFDRDRRVRGGLNKSFAWHTSIRGIRKINKSYWNFICKFMLIYIDSDISEYHKFIVMPLDTSFKNNQSNLYY